MLLLTGATGRVGRALLRRLAAAGTPVRCLVRDPRRLGPDRVRVQIAVGDLADPQSFRNALRGVDTVVHLAATIRDQPRGSIEELNGIATWRMAEAAGRAGVKRFVCAVLDPQLPDDDPSVAGAGPTSVRYELAGPEQLSYEAIVRLALTSFGKRRLLVHVPTPLVESALRTLEVLARSRAFATWDEAELMEVSMVTPAGTSDAERLGVSPRPMADVLARGST